MQKLISTGIGAGTPPGCTVTIDSEPGVSLRSTTRLIAGTPSGVQTLRHRKHSALVSTTEFIRYAPSGLMLIFDSPFPGDHPPVGARPGLSYYRPSAGNRFKSSERA